MLQGGGGHFAHGHQAARLEHVAAHLLQELMDPRPVGIETATVPLGIGREILLFGNQVNHVEAQAVDAFVCPELAHLLQFFADRRVFPVEIGLLGGKQMQVILAAVGMPLPGITAKFGTPVVRRGITFAIAPDVELAERAVRFLRSFEPRVLG
ncbi:hypothetical protein D3C86_1796410 [compost metagenome]